MSASIGDMSGLAGVRFAARKSMLHAFLLICSFRTATTPPWVPPDVVLSATARPSCCNETMSHSSGKNVNKWNVRAESLKLWNLFISELTSRTSLIFPPMSSFPSNDPLRDVGLWLSELRTRS